MPILLAMNRWTSIQLRALSLRLVLAILVAVAPATMGYAHGLSCVSEAASPHAGSDLLKSHGDNHEHGQQMHGASASAPVSGIADLPQDSVDDICVSAACHPFALLTIEIVVSAQPKPDREPDVLAVQSASQPAAPSRPPRA